MGGHFCLDRGFSELGTIRQGRVSFSKVIIHLNFDKA